MIDDFKMIFDEPNGSQFYVDAKFFELYRISINRFGDGLIFYVILDAQHKYKTTKYIKISGNK